MAEWGTVYSLAPKDWGISWDKHQNWGSGRPHVVEPFALIIREDTGGRVCKTQNEREPHRGSRSELWYTSRRGLMKNWMMIWGDWHDWEDKEEYATGKMWPCWQSSFKRGFFFFKRHTSYGWPSSLAQAFPMVWLHISPVAELLPPSGHKQSSSDRHTHTSDPWLFAWWGQFLQSVPTTWDVGCQGFVWLAPPPGGCLGATAIPVYKLVDTTGHSVARLLALRRVI